MQEDITSITRVGFTVIITAALIGIIMLITAASSDVLLGTNAIIDNAVVNNSSQDTVYENSTVNNYYGDNNVTNNYYEDTKYSGDSGEVVVDTTGETIAKVICVIVITAIICGVVIFKMILDNKQKEREHIKEILSIPLETFEDVEMKKLMQKYDDTEE